MKFLLCALLGACATISVCQVPDVQVKADLGPTFLNRVNAGSNIRWYDPFGYLSTVALQFALEPGFRAYVSQKIEKIAHDPDNSQIDESYVEDAGVWRAGKQYLPFGQQRIFRESVLAIRSDTDLFLRSLPASIAACDGGHGRQRGVVGRIGREIGVSFAVGQHFGISGTSMTQIRLPEESPGLNSGWRAVLGADAARTIGVLHLAGEYALFRGGEHGLHDTEILDLTATLQPSLSRSLTFGYSIASRPSINSMRLQGNFLLESGLWLEPWVRTRNGRIFDTGLTVRVRL